ncbi:hypothetical protein K443DRAFT_332764 [Laccaria amethystina LaAM-08-1]|uniref:Uncharacterized protein n=1 Tax=Laccaria amethystina LaAM-08-1 TaxID=1095629 RepID=A0A0C9XBT3_9AGAR|nr:hypothetical protein K443DRAFT_332764 [Laccaria amethystina LaAM-08-1]
MICIAARPQDGNSVEEPTDADLYNGTTGNNKTSLTRSITLHGRVVVLCYAISKKVGSWTCLPPCYLWRTSETEGVHSTPSARRHEYDHDLSESDGALKYTARHDPQMKW